jgi:hypothetical protein
VAAIRSRRRGEPGWTRAVLDRVARIGDEVLISDRVLRVEQLAGRRVARLRWLPAKGSVGTSQWRAAGVHSRTDAARYARIEQSMR